MRASTLTLLVLSFAVGAPIAQAQRTERSAETAPLRTLNRADRNVLRPHLERGPALLAHFYDRHSDISSIVLAGLVDAPADTVAEVIADPAAYPRFMPAMDEVNVSTREGRQTAYDWSWRLAVFRLSGQNVMTTYPGNARRGHRIDVRAIGGDLGTGRMVWRVHPEGPERSMVVLAIRLDMRGANYVADRLSGGGRSVFRSINTILGTVMLLGTEREAERRAGHEDEPRSAEPLARPQYDMMALTRLIGQGDLVFLERDGAAIERVSVVARMGARRGAVRPVMTDPEEFGRSLVHGSRAQIVERTDDHVDFDWEIPLPLVGVSGQMRLHPSDAAIHVEGRSGALRSGDWYYDSHSYPWGDTAIVGWARFDLKETARLVKNLIEDQPDIGHGLAMATQVMVVRSLRNRIHR
jgi:ribosome-associated toxin RatA of RatAB toxin-antitoxin module